VEYATPVWKLVTRVNESATPVNTPFIAVADPPTPVAQPATGVAEACASRIGAFTICAMTFLDRCLVTLTGAALFVSPLAAATATRLGQKLHGWRESVGAESAMPNPKYDAAREARK